MLDAKRLIRQVYLEQRAKIYDRARLGMFGGIWQRRGYTLDFQGEPRLSVTEVGEHTLVANRTQVTKGVGNKPRNKRGRNLVGVNNPGMTMPHAGIRPGPGSNQSLGSNYSFMQTGLQPSLTAREGHYQAFQGDV